MSHNISYQLITAVNECTRRGESKRSDTGGSGRDGGWKIYSNEYHDNLCVTAKSFGRWLKETHPDVRQARDIRQYHVAGYVASRDVTRESAIKLKQHLIKIEKVCSHHYGKCKWEAKDIAVQQADKGPVRTVSAVDAEYRSLVADMRSTGRTEAWKAPVLGRHAGLRVREASFVRVETIRPTGGAYGYGVIVLSGKKDGTKGGRRRVVDILSAEGREALLEVCRGIAPGELIITNYKTGGRLLPGSIDRAITRHKEGAGLDVKKWWNNAQHAFRKEFGQEWYDAMRLSGTDSKTAAGIVNHELGHGKSRKDLTDTYVANQW